MAGYKRSGSSGIRLMLLLLLSPFLSFLLLSRMFLLLILLNRRLRLLIRHGQRTPSRSCEEGIVINLDGLPGIEQIEALKYRKLVWLREMPFQLEVFVQELV